MLSLNSAAYRSRDVLRYDLCLTPVSRGRLPFDYISATPHLDAARAYAPPEQHHNYTIAASNFTLQHRRIFLSYGAFTQSLSRQNAHAPSGEAHRTNSTHSSSTARLHDFTRSLGRTTADVIRMRGTTVCHTFSETRKYEKQVKQVT